MSESKCNYGNINDYKSAFTCFKQRFLVEKKSIFRLGNDDQILTTDSVQYLMDNFVNNGYSGDASFIEKIKHQLITQPKNTTNDENIKKNAIEILATTIWLWRLPPANAKDRKSSVEEVLKLFDPAISIDGNNPFFNDFKGFAPTGTYYNTNKPFALAYIIKFLEAYLKDENNSINILTSNDFNGKMTIKTTKDYSYEDSKNKTNPKIGDTPDSSHDKPRTVSVHNALLHLFDSENYEPILINDHKEKISKVFGEIFNITEDNIDKSIVLIKEKLIELKIETNKQSIFYDKKLINIWQGGFDFESKNLILHGAPGTGKTYMTEETIKSRKLIEKNSEYELVQFHPSYGYEDFIEGIKPVGLQNGQMEFALKNGIFKQMCINAFQELKTNPSNPKKYYFIADEINRAELSRVFGELLLCLEDDKRLRIVDGKVKGTKVKLPNSNLWGIEHVVVFADSEDKLIGNHSPTH